MRESFRYIKYTSSVFHKALNITNSTPRLDALMAFYFGCGFARVAAKLSYLKANGKVEYNNEQRWKRYSEIFQGEHKKRFEVDQYSFNKRSNSIELHFKKWKRAERGKYIAHFS